MATDQQLDIRIHGAQQTQSPVHGGKLPPHGGVGGAGIGPVHGLNGNQSLVASTFFDNFNGSLASFWTVAAWRATQSAPGGLSGNTVVANNRLEVTGPTSIIASAGVTATPQNFTSQSWYVTPSILTAFDANQEFYFAVGPDNTNFLRLVYSGGTLYYQIYSGGLYATIFSTAYVAATHASWRLRHGGASDNRIYADVASSGAANPPASGDWTNFSVSALNPFAMTAIVAALQVASPGSTAAPGKVAFDGFNTAR